MKLSNNQYIVITETVKAGGRSAHTECKTMKSLEKKGLVTLENDKLGTWKPTNKAIILYS